MKKYLVRMEFWQTNKISFIQADILVRKAVKLSALFFLGLLVFTSCKKKEKELGLSVQPQSDQLSLYESDTIELITYSVLGDSLKVDEINGVDMLGSYVDPVFGKMDAAIISELRLESSIDFAANSGSLDSIVIDSVIMYLAMNGGFYGNLDEQTFEVYQLAERLYVDSAYYTNSVVATEATNLVKSGAGVITPNPLTAGNVDGSAVEVPVLRIPLSVNDFGWDIANQSGTTVLNGNDGDGEFLDWYKGLMIKVNNPGQMGNEGGIMYVDMVHELSKVSIYYRDTSGILAEHDSYSFDLNFNAACARFHKVDIDYSNTTVSSLINDSTLGTDMFFVQAEGGVKGKIAFPELDLLAADTNKIINKAELVLPFQYYPGDAYPPAESLVITRTKDDGKEAFLPDVVEGGIDGSADLGTNTYTFNITRYLNGVISGEYDNLPLSLIVNGAGIVASRTVLNGFYSSNKDKPKLILTYTKF